MNLQNGGVVPPIPPVPPIPVNEGIRVGEQEQGMMRLKKLIQEEDEFIVLQSGFIIERNNNN